MRQEKRFVELLSRFITGYVVPLKNSNVVSTQQAHQLVSNIEEIFRFNNNLYLTLAGQPEDLAKVFHENASEFVIYRSYEEGLVGSLEALQELNSMQSFRDFLTVQRKGGDVSFVSFLLLPRQQLDHYRGVLGQMMEVTDPFEPSFSLFNETVAALNGYAAKPQSKKVEELVRGC